VNQRRFGQLVRPGTPHPAVIVQIRDDTEGRASYRRELAAGKTPMEALRCLERCLSDVVYRQLVAEAQEQAEASGTALRGDTSGRRTRSGMTCSKKGCRAVLLQRRKWCAGLVEHEARAVDPGSVPQR
jgi:hypothetical protein